MSFIVFEWVLVSKAYFSLTKADTYSLGLDSDVISPLALSFISVEDMGTFLLVKKYEKVGQWFAAGVA